MRHSVKKVLEVSQILIKKQANPHKIMIIIMYATNLNSN